MNKKFYTVNEAAEMLQVSIVTVYRYVENGKIPCKRVGRAIRIPASYFETNTKVQEIKNFVFQNNVGGVRCIRWSVSLMCY